MPIIELFTHINAPIDRCFDLSRNIDLHQEGLSHTQEEAIDGITTGLISLNEQVTWRAKHFGIWLQITAQITQYHRPYYFRDSMIQGAFKRFHHDHYFEEQNDGTIMRDAFDYTSPLGLIGKVVDVFFLKSYMIKLLVRRNRMIKKVAESDQWMEYLGV